MAIDHLRVLLLADSHLGVDLPTRTRVERRRRGDDFLANYAAALAPALRGEVDVVVHGGDMFDRPRVPSSLVYQALEPLAAVAARGFPVFIVPGNHERSILPHNHLAAHDGVHVFHRPRTVVVEVRGHRIAFSGFPFERRDVRTRFTALLEDSGWQQAGADVRLLCIHHCVEGATVGPADYTFRSAADVIRVRDVPAAFAAVLSGHIHRHQVLTRDLQGRSLATPVLYPGSIERTSFAEAGEAKGFMVLHLPLDGSRDDLRWEFRPLPARPMLERPLAAAGLSAAQFETAVHTIVSTAPADAVLTIRVTGSPLSYLSMARLRALAPVTMNVELRWVDRVHAVSRATSLPRSRRGRGQSAADTGNLTLDL
ncbi:exonuclease SbcCD subunit D [soil metagenome]